MKSFQTNEKTISQIPALKLLVNLGYEYISPEDALKERQGRLANVLLESILHKSLERMNRIQVLDATYLFSEANIQTAVQRLKSVKNDGLLRTNEKIYELLTLGTSLEQTIDNNSRSYDLNYVDWKNVENNQFHVAIEYSVERTRTTETARPDLVLFVNGIPFCVIECKSPQVEVEEGITQMIRNQRAEWIPRLFFFNQLVLSVNKNSAFYGTTGTPKKFWSLWKEESVNEGGSQFKELEELVNRPVGEEVIVSASLVLNAEKTHFNQKRLVTEQDRAIFCLCRPSRLLELPEKFTVFDKGEKKIARYQQYFVVKSTLERVKNFNDEGIRNGGIIWHTQGSGKSLTMVMLARNLAFDSQIRNPRVVLVTDRIDLDKQLGDTFAQCGAEVSRATSGRNLLEFASQDKSAIITTLVHKFEKAYGLEKFKDNSAEIFVLVDEGHRTQFGSFSTSMRQLFPKACYLGFTGTPLLKKEKNNFKKFGKLIKPHYSIRQAVEDGAVVPLLYEGRHVEMIQNQAAVDLWFDRYTQGLTKEEKADLKRKYARAEMLDKADQVIYMRAFDISEHYRSNWQGTGFKAQLVAPNKVSAIKYHKHIRDIGMVSSEVIISGPDLRKGYESIDDEPLEEVTRFWNKMMSRHGNEKDYNESIVNQFKHSPEPEILIVVDKLLTGFDAPLNTVLYICRVLREHTLLQAIARVNRLFDGKDFGYIVDYANVLGELDEALGIYSAFEGFDQADVLDALGGIDKKVNDLPQKHSALWDLFKTIGNTDDLEEFELFLYDQEKRDRFYELLLEFAKAMSIAVSSVKFMDEVDERIMGRYKADLRRFEGLRKSVKLRYGDAVNYKEYEPKIKKLLDIHIQAYEVTSLNDPVNIFDDDAISVVKENRGIYGNKKTTGNIADTIASETKKIANERMGQDPAFYRKFSTLIQNAIEDHKAKRLSDLEYLNTVTALKDQVLNRVHDGLPSQLTGKEDAVAFYGVLKPFVTEAVYDFGDGVIDVESVAADTAVAIGDILERHSKVHFWKDKDAQNLVVNEIDDFLFDHLKRDKGIELSGEQMDRIIEDVLKVAKHRSEA